MIMHKDTTYLPHIQLMYQKEKSTQKGCNLREPRLYQNSEIPNLVRNLVKNHAQKGCIGQTVTARKGRTDGNAVREIVHGISDQVEPSTGFQIGLHGGKETQVCVGRSRCSTFRRSLGRWGGSGTWGTGGREGGRSLCSRRSPHGSGAGRSRGRRARRILRILIGNTYSFFTRFTVVVIMSVTVAMAAGEFFSKHKHQKAE